jgi:hypothetical protein
MATFVEFQKLKEITWIPFLVGNHFISHAKSPKFIGRLMHRQTISASKMHFFKKNLKFKRNDI